MPPAPVQQHSPSQPPDQGQEHPSEAPRRSPTQPPDQSKEHPSKAPRRSPSQPPDKSEERPSKAPRLATSQPPDQSKERPAKAAPISASKPPPPRRPPLAAQRAKAAADKLTRLQSKQAYLRKDRDRQQLQATIVGARIPKALSDIPALELSLDKHCAVRDHQDQRLRALPAELASLYLQLQLPFGQQEYLTKIQARLLEEQQVLAIYPQESQRIDTLARDLQGARDSVHRNEAELGRIRDTLVRLQTESDSLTAEIQAVYLKVNLGFPYNPKTVDLLPAGYEHDEMTSAALPQCELDETVGFLKSDAARSTVLNIPASRRFILAAAYLSQITV